ncbi:MAG TPA: TusE/DsrC/DsvC family sulfur relay protein [Burkholderiaceae bacterium]|nr:TusE/DsrC/DsvC family sulfur relay protein [Burkholderiaceae bacterium]
MDARVNITLPVRTIIARPEFDADGFLVCTPDWSPAMAVSLAREEGIDGLGATHWKVIHLVRDRYFSLGALPVMRLVCRAAGLDPRQAHHLFSSCRSLWRIAGLPNPGEEAKAYMN